MTSRKRRRHTPDQIIRKLAEGGMAEVFLAQVEGPGGFQKPVVVKRVLPELSKDQQFVAMFLSEAKLVAQLNHPNIVSVYDWGTYQNTYFMAMEYVEGQNLADMLRSTGHLTARQSSEIASEVAAALAFAHRNGGYGANPAGCQPTGTDARCCGGSARHFARRGNRHSGCAHLSEPGRAQSRRGLGRSRIHGDRGRCRGWCQSGGLRSAANL